MCSIMIIDILRAVSFSVFMFRINFTVSRLDRFMDPVVHVVLHSYIPLLFFSTLIYFNVLYQLWHPKSGGGQSTFVKHTVVMVMVVILYN